jgi:cyclopropane-fatty-acyl-phospholipid synthase
MNFAEKKIKEILDIAKIKINGNNPEDIIIHNPIIYSKIFSNGSLALGEEYMDQTWEAQKLDYFFNRILSVNFKNKFNPLSFIPYIFISKIFNFQTKSKSRIVGEKHYDMGNELYEAMLDKKMIYTCGYWKDSANLDEAQENKLELVCKKIGLKPDEKILDIGCGWGGFAKYAAEKYGARVTGVTISKEQAELARQKTKGLPVKIKLQDYRDVNEKFNHVISLGMFEHVGPKNYKQFFQKVNLILKDDGLFLLHTIGGNTSKTHTDPWIHKYIFPNGVLPSIAQIGNATEDLFVMEDWHNFGLDYDKTLMAWFENFDKNWENLKHNYDDKFYRMWEYYLKSCAGTFRAKKINLWQIVFSKKGSKIEYQSIR